MTGPEHPPSSEHAMKLNALVCFSLITFVSALNPASLAQTYSVIHEFSVTGNSWDGAAPYGGVILSAGALYGTTSRGGNGPALGPGTAYQMTHVGSDWTFTPILVLPATNLGGYQPWARVVFGPDDHLYGTTGGGGANNGGVVFDLTPPVSICMTVDCLWTENVLYNFASSNEAGPRYGDLIWDQQGNIYGTTLEGGVNNKGTVYQLTPSGNGWQENILHSFDGLDGFLPYAGVVFDNKGNLWGTTAYGGVDNDGTIFELTYVPGVGWQETVVYQFLGDNGGGVDEEYSFAGVVFDRAGNVYGVTNTGGPENAGAVFELSPSGKTYTFKVLYRLPAVSPNCGPSASLTLDAAGNLYGTTLCSGAYQFGNVFKLSNTPNGWVYSSLHDFAGPPDDGSMPISQVTIDTDGTLYGTTTQGGSSPYCLSFGCGVVWMIKP